MRHVTLYIPDNKYPLFMELARSIDFIKKIEEEESEEPSKEEVIRNLKRGFEEMQLIKKGKLKTTPLKDFLNEL
jgi:hypothetical protein